MIGEEVVDMIFKGFIIGFIVGALATLITCSWTFTRSAHKDAVSHGCAHYVVTDTLSGKTEFQWKATP